MKHSLDPNFAACVQQTLKELGIPPDQPSPRFSRGDVNARREGAGFARVVLNLEPEITNVVTTQYAALAEDGYEIPILGFRKKQEKSSELQPAVLYLHGGGMILGSAEMFESVTKADVAATGVAHFSVNYRLAPEAPDPTPIRDCYAALLWLHLNANKLGIDNSRIGVCGLSAGGGLAAGVCLMARDHGLSPPVAKQILLCPMLDDRNVEPEADLVPFATWTWDDNWTGWSALLGERRGTDAVSAYAAPARAVDVKNLPSTYIDVGTVDIFAKEDKVYATRLKDAGVQVEWHLYEGVPHAFEFRGRQSTIKKKADGNRRRAVMSF
ncbi:alpha/beta hydrolase [Paraphoma chrysanthemicola]|nr:alpha/beta hydrolase [Paraphoma chrysanthemicola]